MRLAKRQFPATKLLEIPLDETVTERHRHKIVIEFVMECFSNHRMLANQKLLA